MAVSEVKPTDTKWAYVRKALAHHKWTKDAIKHVVKHVPYAQALRIVDTLSKDDTPDKRHFILKNTHLAICTAGGFQEKHIISYLRTRIVSRGGKINSYSVAEALASRICAWGDRVTCIGGKDVQSR